MLPSIPIKTRITKLIAELKVSKSIILFVNSVKSLVARTDEAVFEKDNQLVGFPCQFAKIRTEEKQVSALIDLSNTIHQLTDK